MANIGGLLGGLTFMILMMEMFGVATSWLADAMDA